MKTLVGLFDSYEDATRAVEVLQEQGVDKHAIGIVAREDLLRKQFSGRQHAVVEDAGAGALSGATVGGILGALVGLGTLAIPGIGTVLAVGTLAAAIGTATAGVGVGAAAGGLIGALVGAGVPKEDVLFYTEGMRRGGVLVTVQVNDDRVLETLNTLRQARMVDMDQRRGEWQRDGWNERKLGEPIAPSDTGARPVQADREAPTPSTEPEQSAKS
jgi:hypothetical protein